VVGVDVQVALGLDLEVDHAVARNLVEHVVEEGTPVAASMRRAVEVDDDA
jgi:hypothetical protein